LSHNPGLAELVEALLFDWSTRNNRNKCGPSTSSGQTEHRRAGDTLFLYIHKGPLAYLGEDGEITSIADWQAIKDMAEEG